MEQITTALISGLVALLVGGGSALLSLTQIRREHRRWLTDLKVAWSLELHKSRMATYPEAHRGLAPLSHASPDAVTPQVAGEVAQQLNNWLYSAGGLCADATTRGALLGLRECCRNWAATGGPEPEDLYAWRNLLGTFLRRDLDVLGLESYDFDLDPTLLSKLQRELESARRRRNRNGD
ncbi:hypothetical protein OHU34_45355 (plasmid) [Streptomyces sp. NBC_00080]|uniref:hypothetical protein n=1 Tax=unclassified Streptomyces TaxID=2593676 RepID=UPI00114D979C|nr:hypothetical protein [Streptomyces sp. SLBN-115]TQJ37860.1 hypothetical protein FBY34_8027 [Streptomyces sp. SLBN-115]